MLMYLSENVEGGETHFPMVSILHVDYKFPSLTMFFFAGYVFFSLLMISEFGTFGKGGADTDHITLG